MHCPRCRGMMYTERFQDFFLAFYAWKCINCGTVIDPLIAKNRAQSHAGAAAGSTSQSSGRSRLVSSRN